MTLTIEITCDNAAFDPAAAEEVARILRSAADRAEEIDLCALDCMPLRDINGNKVGECRLTD